MEHSTANFSAASLRDNRFRNLLGQKCWNLLTPAIRRRFGKRIQGGESVTYQGQVVAMELSFAGMLLAHSARLFGSPLPYDASCLHQPAVVTVTEDISGDGQFWIRQYGRRSGFPQLVHSSKRFAGPTGLEEYIGYGIGMSLKVEAQHETLFFKSDHFFLQIFGRRICLPRWLSPGSLLIGHHDMGEDNFMFSLELRNRTFGRLIRQDVLFQDAKE